MFTFVGGEDFQSCLRLEVLVAVRCLSMNLCYFAGFAQASVLGSFEHAPSFADIRVPEGAFLE